MTLVTLALILDLAPRSLVGLTASGLSESHGERGL